MKKRLLSCTASLFFVVTQGACSNLEKAKVDLAKTDARTLAAASEQFYLTKAKAPVSIGELVNAQFIQSAPKDPWGHDYVLAAPGTKSGKTVDVYSPGPDGIPGSGDDVGNW